MFLLIISIIFVGSFNSFSTLIEQILFPFDYSENSNLFGFIFLIAGGISTLFIGKIVDKYKKYKLIYQFLLFLWFFSLFLIVLGLYYGFCLIYF